MKLILSNSRCYILFLVIFIFGVGPEALAQETRERAEESIRLELAESITPVQLKSYVSTLASDAMEGRETGTTGNNLAAKFISEKFEEFGLEAIGSKGTYYQPIDMVSVHWKKIEFTINDTRYRHMRDFYAMQKGNDSLGILQANDFFFVGYGIENGEIDHYRNADVRGKVVLMYGGEPRGRDGNSIITNSSEASEWTTDPYKKINLAKSKGARLVFIIAEHFKQDLANNRKFLIGPPVQLVPPKENNSISDKNSPFGYCFISTEMAKAMIGKKLNKVIRNRDKMSRKKNPKPMTIAANIQGEMSKRVNMEHTANVIGRIPGSDDSKKNEHVIITAHFDHLGKRGNDIFNGADDNASGTSTVIELARQFSKSSAEGYRPKRPIIFLLVTGEEKGLLGSEFYVKHPIVPLEDLMVNVNIDMVGRKDKLQEDPNYIYVIGADRLSTTLHDVNEEVNKKFEQIKLDYTYNAKDDPNRFYYRSDHYNFAKNNIPAVFFFSGTHDDYHRPSDTTEKIDFDKMTTISRHIFHLVWELANREEAIEVNVN